MTPELLSFVSFSAGVLISCTVFVFVLRGRVLISKELDRINFLTAIRLAELEQKLKTGELKEDGVFVLIYPPKPE